MSATIDTLRDSITLVLEDCVCQANKANDETLDQISKEALNIVKENAPARENGGIYKKGLKRKKTKDERDDLQYTLYASGMESSLSLNIVKENAPARENGGIYKKGLKRKKTKDERDDLQYTLYASGMESSLSHLLENGHLTRNGETTVPGKPHFAKGQE